MQQPPATREHARPRRRRGRPTSPTARTELGKRSWQGVLKRTVREFKEDNLTDWAAALTYYGDPLDLPGAARPRLDPRARRRLGDAAADRQPRHRRARSREGHRDERDRGDPEPTAPSGVLAIVGILVALWSASNYVGAFMRASNAIYEIGRRPPVLEDPPAADGRDDRHGAAARAVRARGRRDRPGRRDGRRRRRARQHGRPVWDIAKWPFLAIVFMTMLGLLYYAAPNVEHPRFRWITPGAVAAVILWLLASAAFAFYVANFGSYDKTYGTLGGVIVFLTWLWISNIAVLLGAEINAEAERGRQIERGMDPDTGAVPAAARHAQARARSLTAAPLEPATVQLGGCVGHWRSAPRSRPGARVTARAAAAALRAARRRARAACARRAICGASWRGSCARPPRACRPARSRRSAAGGGRTATPSTGCCGARAAARAGCARGGGGRGGRGPGASRRRSSTA